MKFGLNLFSIRSLLKTENNFLITANKLKEMGYDYLQFSGAPYNPDVIARVSRESGLPICLTHVPMERIIGETDKLMEEHAKFQCKNIGLGMMPQATIWNENAFKEKVEELDKAGEKMQKNGFKFFYHHHHFEFFQYNGVTALEYMRINAPHINFTLDSYWAQYGGVDVLTLIEQLKGRIDCVHLKDYKIAVNKEGNDFVPMFAPVGDGTINFPRVIDKMKDSGAKYFLVEQDNASDFPDPLGQVERSVRYLKSL